MHFWTITKIYNNGEKSIKHTSQLCAAQTDTPSTEREFNFSHLPLARLFIIKQQKKVHKAFSARSKGIFREGEKRENFFFIKLFFNCNNFLMLFYFTQRAALISIKTFEVMWMCMWTEKNCVCGVRLCVDIACSSYPRGNISLWKEWAVLRDNIKSA